MSGTAAMGGSMVIQGDNTNMVLEDLCSSMKVALECIVKSNFKKI